MNISPEELLGVRRPKIKTTAKASAFSSRKFTPINPKVTSVIAYLPPCAFHRVSSQYYYQSMTLPDRHNQNLALLGIGLGAGALAIVSLPIVLQLNEGSVTYDNTSFLPAPLNQGYSHVAVARDPHGYIFVAGQRGVTKTCASASAASCLVPMDSKVVTDKTGTHTLKGYSRIYKAYQNMKEIATARGAGLNDTVRLVAYTTDLNSYRATADYIESLPEFWSHNPPPRSIVQVSALDESDVFEVEGTFQINR